MTHHQPEFGTPLTPRETQVAIAMLFGHSCKTIGRELGIQTRTIETHRANIMAKYGAHCLGEFVAKVTEFELPASLRPQEDVSG
jgi:FixJ family two-component response regulator